MSTPFRFVCVASGLAFFPGALLAQFDLGKLRQGINQLEKAAGVAKDAGKVAKGAAGIGPEEERVIGGSVALEIIGAHGGLLRDEAVTRRVNLVGKTLARYCSRPGLEWRFGVLASETINAFSAPGGYVFITKGLYELAATDDALAAVLAHEIAHIARRHALTIVSRGEFVSGATTLAKKHSGQVQQLEGQLRQFDIGIEQIAKTLLEQGFDPQTEYEADRDGRALAGLTGYSRGGMRAVLLQLQQRKTGADKIFSTHPPLAERLKNLPTDPLPTGP